MNPSDTLKYLVQQASDEQLVELRDLVYQQMQMRCKVRIEDGRLPIPSAEELDAFEKGKDTVNATKSYRDRVGCSLFDAMCVQRYWRDKHAVDLAVQTKVRVSA